MTTKRILISLLVLVMAFAAFQVVAGDKTSCDKTKCDKPCPTEAKAAAAGCCPKAGAVEAKAAVATEAAVKVADSNCVTSCGAAAAAACGAAAKTACGSEAPKATATVGMLLTRDAGYATVEIVVQNAETDAELARSAPLKLKLGI